MAIVIDPLSRVRFRSYRIEEFFAYHVQLVLLLVRFLDFFELCKLCLDVLLSLPLSINHIHVLVEMFLYLSNFLDNHGLDFGILLIDLLYRPLVHLADNPVQNLCLKLVFEVLGEGAELWHSLQFSSHFLETFLLNAIFKIGFCLLCCVLNLL